MNLNQYFTAAWAAELLFSNHFSHLTTADCVWEPTCGKGHMLAAIPSHIPCIGTEIDPNLATEARERTGRNVLIGDCRSVQLPKKVTCVFGNPPFSINVFAALLTRCADMLDEGQKAGFILPAYFMQTSRTLLPMAKSWEVSQEIIPRDLFPGLSKPILFATFVRASNCKLIGFSLFAETAAINELSKEVKDSLHNNVKGPRSVWKQTITEVVQSLGGTAHIAEIYKAVEGKRPTGTQFWKEQIRKVLHQSFIRVDEGKYSIAA